MGRVGGGTGRPPVLSSMEGPSGSHEQGDLANPKVGTLLPGSILLGWGRREKAAEVGPQPAQNLPPPLAPVPPTPRWTRPPGGAQASPSTSWSLAWARAQVQSEQSS